MHGVMMQQNEYPSGVLGVVLSRPEGDTVSLPGVSCLRSVKAGVHMCVYKEWVAACYPWVPEFRVWDVILTELAPEPGCKVTVSATERNRTWPCTYVRSLCDLSCDTTCASGQRSRIQLIVSVGRRNQEN